MRSQSGVLVTTVVLACFGCDAGAPATSEPATTAKTDTNHAAIRDANGDYALYTGRDVLGRIQRGENLEDVPYMLVRVPADLVTAAQATPGHVVSLSLEEPGSDIEIAVHWQGPPETPTADAPPFTTEVFHPGDPWLTGIAQVYLPERGPEAVGLFELTKWVKGAHGELASQTHSTGLAPDDRMPTLNYSGRPTQWPALPDNWR